MLGAGGGSLAMTGDERQTAQMLDACWKAGLSYYDTAPLYGESESRLGRFLMGRARESFVVSTKVGRMPAPSGRRHFDFSREATATSVRRSLDRLGIGYIDVLLVHDLTPEMLGSSFDACRRELLGSTFEYLAELRRDGIVRTLGLALYDPATAVQLLAEAAFDCVMIAGSYSLLNQEALAALLPYCLDRGIGVLSASPFHTGLLVTGAIDDARFNYQQAGEPVLDKVRRIESVCSRHSVTLPAAAIQFPLFHPAVASVVVGHQTPREVKTNLGWLQDPIPAAFWNELLDEGLLPAGAPVA
jgi:D-threo-aldose 1-dehydrogenase